ncbi:hypothetical protein RZN22_06310 [Bacillaceae bacterium S4-13-58]
MKKDVVCKYCNKKINNRDELVTASALFKVQPFHYVCFQKVTKETTISWTAWKPLNTVTGVISMVLMIVLSVILLGTDLLADRTKYKDLDLGNIIGIIALYPLLLRIISFGLYESRLPKQ